MAAEDNILSGFGGSTRELKLELARKKSKKKSLRTSSSDSGDAIHESEHQCSDGIGDFGDKPAPEPCADLKVPCESEERIPSTTRLKSVQELVERNTDNFLSTFSKSPFGSTPKINLSSLIPKECQVCFEPCDLACKSCQKVYYCSKNHQISDWSRHKLDCFPGIFTKNENGEKVFIATKDIPQDGKIMREKPFLIVPSTTERVDHICFGCYEEVETSVSCSHCKWDVCSEKCEKDSLHASFECDVFAKKCVLPPVACNAVLLLDAVAALRCLLMKERDPDRWRRFTSLSWVHRTEPLPVVEIDQRVSVQNCIKFIREDCGQTQFDEALIERAHKILLLNKLHVPDIPATIKDTRRAALMFKNFVVPGTCCIPNARWAVGGRQTMKYFAVIGASVDIKRGQEIHCDFAQSLCGTYVRRQSIKAHQDRFCRCERCRDPTECCTYLTALKCRDNVSCPGGNVIPEDPLDNCTEWKCDACGDRVDPSHVFTQVNRVNDELVDVGANFDDVSLKELHQIIKKYKGTVLHENHFLIVNAEYDYCHRVMQQSNHVPLYDMKASWGEKVTEYCRHILSVTQNIMPGLQRYKGRVMCCLHIGLLMSVFGQKAGVGKKRGFAGAVRKFKQKKFEETINAQRKAIEYLTFEPDDSDEAEMVRILTEKLKHQILM